MNFRAALFLIFSSLISFISVGQTIKGEVFDKDNQHPLAGATIVNVYTSLEVTTGADGSFVMAASGDQLLEFKKTGFKTAKVRIPKGYSPSYYKIILEHGFTKPTEIAPKNDNRYSYVQDSIRYHDLYQHEIDFPKLSGVNVVAHPFSALSKRNREIWKFQDDYDQFEHEKYIDKTFNAEVVQKYTGLSGDSLTYYLKRYRPEYGELRAMNDYTFFNYIKKTVTKYRNSRATHRGAQ